MQDLLILRFDAPLMSFGGVAVDVFGVIDRWPSTSLLTGLFANALGYDHRDFAALQSLQSAIHYAVRCDRTGRSLRDFQTVDLGQPHLLDAGAWTTWGRMDPREGGTSASTHIRHRDYWVDSVYTLAVLLQDGPNVPKATDMERALRRPERPLFLGRKCCIPSTPIFQNLRKAKTPLTALEELPRLSGGTSDEGLPAWWDPRVEQRQGQPRYVNDTRDWANQVHVGRRLLHFGLIHPPEANHA